MRLRNLLVLLATLVTTALCRAQAPASGVPHPIELGFSYTAVRANFVPGDCGCFWLNGGAAEVSVGIVPHLSAVFDAAAQHVSSINAANANLGLATFAAGPRFLLRPTRRWQPYGQALFGVVHAFDAQLPVNNTLVYSGASFGMLAGGGLDVELSPRVILRPFAANYELSRLPNSVNGYQNSVRFEAGIRFRIDR